MGMVFCPSGIWAFHTIGRNRGIDGGASCRSEVPGEVPLHFWVLFFLEMFVICSISTESFQDTWWWRTELENWAGNAGSASGWVIPPLDLSYSDIPIGLGGFVSICTKLCWFLWSLTLTSLGVLGKSLLFFCLTCFSAGMEEEGQIIIFFSFGESIMIWHLLE